MPSYEGIFYNGGLLWASIIISFLKSKQTKGFFHNVQVAAAIRTQFNSKLSRIIKSQHKEIKKIIIMTDADGGSIEDKENRLSALVPKKDRDRTSFVIFTNEIEDWICYSLDMKITDSKPSKVLELLRGYKKSDLPKYAPQIDCKKLDSCASFKKLQKILG